MGTSSTSPRCAAQQATTVLPESAGILTCANVNVCPITNVPGAKPGTGHGASVWTTTSFHRAMNLKKMAVEGGQ